ncbi:MAG TPA: hypothetical protein VLI54_03445 [Bacillota bacterium]|nr:hypothetical protein [Bacillota bacterium]
MHLGKGKLENPTIVGLQIDTAAALIKRGLPEDDWMADPNVDLRVKYLSDTVDLDPRIAGAYLSRSVAPHLTDLPEFDRVMVPYINEQKRETLQRAMGYHAFLAEPSLRYIDECEGSERVREALLRRRIDWSGPSIAVWIRGMRENGKSDMLSTALRGIAVMHHIAYAPEMGLAQERVYSLPDVRMPASLFAPGEYVGGVTESALTHRLRERGLLDMSKERLDRRFNNLFRVLQLEVSALFLGALQDLWILDPRQRAAANQLFMQQRAHLWTYDALSKGKMLETLRQRLQRLAQTSQHPQEKETMEAMAERVGAQILHLARAQVTYVDIYDRLGYALPSGLKRYRSVPILPQEPEQPRERNVGDVITSITIIPGLASKAKAQEPTAEEKAAAARAAELAAAREAALTRLSARAEALQTEAVEAAKSWTLNDKARTTAGLDLARHTFMSHEGCLDDKGHVLVPHMERPEAEELVAVLHHLGRMGGRKNLTAAQQALAADIATHNRLATERQQLQRDVLDASADRGILPPPVLALGVRVARIQAEWRGFRPAVERLWPPETAKAVVAHIERLLFASPDQPVQ